MGKVQKCPFAWVEEKAWDFPTIWSAIHRHHPPGHPVSPHMIATIFFEETGFCNIQQAGTKGTLGIGFGQMEISNPEKREFYAWLGLPTDYRIVAGMILGSNDLAVKVHCMYFQFLSSVKGKGYEGCMHAQVGTHTSYIPLLAQGASLLRKAIDANDRALVIQALNYARSNGPKHNGVGEKYFPDYWAFTLPPAWFKVGF